MTKNLLQSGFSRRPAIYSVKSIRGIFIVAATISGSACSLVPGSPIPGGETNPVTLKPIHVTTVLSALKCQVDRGIKMVEKRKNELRANGDPRADTFNLLEGTATFSGKTTIVGTDDGDVSILIPTGISEVTPNFGGKFTSTATEDVARKFGVGNETDDVSICDHKTLKDSGVVVGTFIADRMLAAFNDTAKIPLRRNAEGALVSYGPKLQNTELKITATFNVQRVLDAGVKAKVLFSSTNPSSPTLSPGIAFINDEKGEYSISVTFPMLAADTGDKRRFFQCIHPGGATYCLEVPYVEKKHKDIFPDIVAIAPGGVLGQIPSMLLRPSTSAQPSAPTEGVPQVPKTQKLDIQKGPTAF